MNCDKGTSIEQSIKQRYGKRMLYSFPIINAATTYSSGFEVNVNFENTKVAAIQVNFIIIKFTASGNTILIKDNFNKTLLSFVDDVVSIVNISFNYVIDGTLIKIQCDNPYTQFSVGFQTIVLTDDKCCN